MRFTKEEQGIAKFLCEYLGKRHGRQISVCLADSNDVFCATDFDGKKIIEMGVSLLEMGNSELKASEENARN